AGRPSRSDVASQLRHGPASAASRGFPEEVVGFPVGAGLAGGIAVLADGVQFSCPADEPRIGCFGQCGRFSAPGSRLVAQRCTPPVPTIAPGWLVLTAAGPGRTLAPPPGFEPGPSEPKSEVLPLHHGGSGNGNPGAGASLPVPELTGPGMAGRAAHATSWHAAVAWFRPGLR